MACSQRPTGVRSTFIAMRFMEKNSSIFRSETGCNSPRNRETRVRRPAPFIQIDSRRSAWIFGIEDRGGRQGRPGGKKVRCRRCCPGSAVRIAESTVSRTLTRLELWTMASRPRGRSRPFSPGCARLGMAPGTIDGSAAIRIPRVVRRRSTTDPEDGNDPPHWRVPDSPDRSSSDILASGIAVAPKPRQGSATSGD